MSTWYKKDLGNGVEASGPTRELQIQFLEAFNSASCPVDMAIFSGYGITTGIVTMYFSPGAKDIAVAFGATPCDKPINEPLYIVNLSVGDSRARELYYPAS